MSPISATFALLLGSLLTSLAMNTTRQRLRFARDAGPEAKESIRRASRAHGNTLEHGLPFLLLIFFAERGGASATWLWVLCGLFVAGRISYAYGMLTRPTSPPMRYAAALTYLLEIALLATLARTLLAS
ncbi:MAG: MAPEG family protein [Myxococcales bacterium]|nr:MAPEG family protein [Myxococcales bacterium]MCB9701520.1 MAPEG family protein [Myxococcales bacterium]